MSKVEIPKIAQDNLCDSSIWKIRVQEMYKMHLKKSAGDTFGLRPSDLLYISIDEKPIKQKVNIYYNGKSMMFIPGVRRNMEYLGTILGKAPN